MEFAIFLLWLFLHHKIFLSRLADVTEDYKSGLIKIFTETGALLSYQRLKRHDMFSWVQEQWPEDAINELDPCVKRMRSDLL